MIRKTLLPMLAIALGLGILTACALLSPQASFAPTHPEALGAGRPTCSECHGAEAMKGGLKTYEAFNHTESFVKEHRLAATQDPAACASCHSQAFCSDCHGGKVAMMPSVKLGNRPDREMPHRGNYLVVHRLDGKADPTGCYKCHGRANNDKCMGCHR